MMQTSRPKVLLSWSSGKDSAGRSTSFASNPTSKSSGS